MHFAIICMLLRDVLLHVFSRKGSKMYNVQ